MSLIDDYYVKLLKYSRPNSEARQRYAKGIIKAEHNIDYKKGEMNNVDDLYEFLINFNVAKTSDNKHILKRIKKV